MESRIEKITPSAAAKYLQANKGNRHVRQKAVSMLAEAMKRGEWRLTHQGISISSDGVLLDGQHRLMAVVESGVSIEMVVWSGVDPSTFSVLDRGINRTMADAVKLPPRQVEVLTLLHMLKNSRHKKATPQQIDRLGEIFIPEISELMELAPSHTKNFSQAGVRAAVVILAKEGQRNRAFDLYRKMTLGDVTELPPSAVAMVKQVIKGSFTSGTAGGAQVQSFCKTLFALDQKNEKRTSIPSVESMRDAMVARAVKWMD